MKKVLIFGIGGFVGPYLATEFTSVSYRVFGSDIMRECSISGCESYMPCDLTDADSVRELLEKIQPDLIVNLAAVSSVGLSWKIPSVTVHVNVCGTLNILESARLCAPDCRILLIGSSEEYVPSEQPLTEESPTRANNPYGISKAMMGQFCELYRTQYGMKIYQVRAFNHTGIGQKDTFVLPSWCRQAAEIAAGRAENRMRTGNLHVRRDFSDVRDIVHAYRLVAESEDCSQIYNVGSGIAWELGDLLRKIITISGKEIQVATDPALVREVDNPVICCDNTKIRSRLSWAPVYSIEETLKEMFDYYVERGRA